MPTIEAEVLLSARDGQWPAHLEADVFQTLFCDVRLYSVDKSYVPVPAALLAVLSPKYLAPILRELHDRLEEPLSVLTELPYALLMDIQQFLLTGCIYEAITEEMRMSFQVLGIQIEGLKFQEEILQTDLKVSTSVNHELLKDDDDNWDYLTVPEQDIKVDNDDMDTYSVEEDVIDVDEDNMPLRPQRKSRQNKRNNNQEKDKDKRIKVEKHFKCHVCDFQAKAILPVEQHVLRHRVKDSALLEDDVLYCTVLSCLEKLPSFEDLKRHYLEKHQNKIFQCMHCSNGYSRIRARDLHIRLHHSTGEEDGVRMIVCAHCGSQFTHPSAWKRHQKFESTYHSNTCVHPDCSFKFETWPEHRKHLDTAHDGIMLHICGVCPELFECRKTKKQHRFDAHKKEMAAHFKECELCGAHTISITRHKALAHDIDEPGHCKICDKDVEKRYSHEMTHKKTTAKDEALCSSCGLLTSKCRKTDCKEKKPKPRKPRNPKTKKSEPSGPFPCQECAKVYDTLSRLRTHVTVEHKSSEEKPSLPCPFCPKICSSIAGRHFHITHTHKYPFRCRSCKKRFQTSEELVKHKSTPCKSHWATSTCEICGKVVRTKSLKEHIANQHTSDDKKPFRCHLCPRGFARVKNLKEHINTHTNSRPYQCQFCGASFNSSCSLSTHEIKQHKRARKDIVFYI